MLFIDHQYTDEQIRPVAYRYWQNAAEPKGDSVFYWMQAIDMMYLLDSLDTDEGKQALSDAFWSGVKGYGRNRHIVQISDVLKVTA